MERRNRDGRSESPTKDNLGKAKVTSRIFPSAGRHISQSCTNLPETSIHPRSSGNVSSLAPARLNINSEYGQACTHLPAPLVTMGYELDTLNGNPNFRKPVVGTLSAPRGAPTNRHTQYSSDPPNHKVPAANLRKNAITNASMEYRHTTLGNRMSWSPTRQTNNQPFRLRVLSDSQGGARKTISRSLRIKKWIQNKHNSGSQEDSQNIFYTAEEADDEGRPCSNFQLHDIHEENEKDMKKRTRKEKVRRLSKVSGRKRDWCTEIDRVITPELESCSNDIEESTNIEQRLLEISSGWNPQEVREQRFNALRAFLTTKKQPLTVLNLLETGKIAEAVALAREGNRRIKLDVCLLWACLQGAADLVLSLIEAGANVDAKDNAGFSAMHLAAENGSEEVIQVLLKGGAKVNTSGDCWDYNHEVTPLMLAAKSGCIKSIEALISAGANVNAGINSGKETPLHHAVHAAIPECVQILLSAGADPNPTVMYSETPLHIAVYEELPDIVDILISAGADVKASRGNLKMTALHIAAHEGYSRIAHQLLKAGADPNQENQKGQTPLHLAAKSQSFDTVQVLLSFDANPNACDRDHKTPLHSGIFKGSRSHECLRLLLEAGADTNAPDLSGYTPLHLAAVHDSTYCVLLFLDHGGDVTACTHGGISALNLIIRRTPTVLTHIQENLDAAIGFTDHDHDHEPQVQMNFRVLIPGEGYGLECRMLSCFIREGQKALLKHPLCETLLFLKWLKVRNFFILNLIFFAFIVLMLTVYIMTVFPKVSECHLNFENNKTNTTKDCELNNKTAMQTLLYFIWIFISLLALKELFQIIDTPKTYFSSWENMLVWPIIIITFTITITSYLDDDTKEWEHHLAAIVILLSWVKLMLLIGRFPVFGLYVLMFTHVTKNFAKFILAYICLINAFSLSFGVLFPNHQPFNMYILRFVKTLVMMTGEIEYDEWFYDDNKKVMYQWTSHIIFAVFLIFVTIILMNLLVGLAVSDIQGLQKSAGLDRLVRETQQISQFEGFMFSKWLTWVIPRGLLWLLHKGILICPSLYGGILVRTSQALTDTGLSPELVDVILRTAHARDQATRRRNAFANFRSLSKTAQYSGDDGDVQKSIDALRFGLDLLVWDADDRRDDSVFLRSAIGALSEDIEKVTDKVNLLVNESFCPKCKENRRDDNENGSLFASCDSPEKETTVESHTTTASGTSI